MSLVILCFLHYVVLLPSEILHWRALITSKGFYTSFHPLPRAEKTFLVVCDTSLGRTLIIINGNTPSTSEDATLGAVHPLQGGEERKSLFTEAVRPNSPQEFAQLVPGAQCIARCVTDVLQHHPINRVINAQP